jgi:hypothetical protein
MRMDRQQMQRCLEQVTEYQASGQKAGVWALARGISVHALASWCRNAPNWRAIIAGVAVAPPSACKPGGFVAARVAPSSAPPCVRVELSAGALRLDLHWPLSHTRELSALVRELAR